jgi:hypothetical protein
MEEQMKEMIENFGNDGRAQIYQSAVKGKLSFNPMDLKLPLTLLLVVFGSKGKGTTETTSNKVADTPTTVKASKVPAGKDLKSALADLTEKDVAAKGSPAEKKKDQKDEAAKKKAEPVKKTRAAAAKRKIDSKVEESSAKKLKAFEITIPEVGPKKKKGGR